jgi:lysine 2,3-aminomutase
MKKIGDLAKLTNSQFEKINEQYPIKISTYLLEQIKKSKNIANQFLPSIKELNNDILVVEPFKGLLETDVKVFERLYEERIVLKLTSICPSHCRFCYRRGFVFGEEKNIDKKELLKAIEIVKSEKSVRNVLLTGGIPLVLGLKKIELVINEIAKIDHIKQIYFALGRPIMGPSIITDEFAKMISTLNNSLKDKSIACTVHINHPDELTEEVTDSLKKLSSKGITIWTQSTLLKGINDDPIVFSELCQKFRANNLIPYYLIHAMPMIGSSHFRTSVKKGVEIMKYFEQFSGHERPIYIVIPSAGKVQLSGDSKLKYKRIEGKKYVLLNTSYKASDFLQRNELNELPEYHYVDKRGFIVAAYLDGKD